MERLLQYWDDLDDLFGIKRIRDSRFLCRPDDTWEHDPSWQDVRTSGNTVEYSLECEVVALDRGSGDDVDADRLLEELRGVLFTVPDTDRVARLDEVVDLIRGPANTVVRLQIIPAGALPGSGEKITLLITCA